MTGLLDSIEDPADLRELDPRQLQQLAGEVRELIIDVVSRNRGHLASNLGVVELTLALHYCFDFAHDRLVWDCGHQAYTHKIITGRREEFPTLRQKQGVSGFANRTESPYDTFTFGHTATSISAALGLANAAKLKGREEKVVAVIGDGAMASGMAFEALNHAGALEQDLLVVLNDNKMSISRSVGAIAHYLRKVRATPPFADIRREVQDVLGMIPVVGHRFDTMMNRLRDAIQTAITPGGLFVDFGFNYYGPVNGHNLDELTDAFRDLKRVDGPVLLHVLTEKGHGFSPACEDPTKFHSSKRFELADGTLTGLEKPSGVSYSKVFGTTLCEIAEKNPDVVAITAAMPDGTGLTDFADRFPDRFHDVGICEQHAVGLANGLATGGLKPVFAVYSTFLQRAVDQVNHDMALQESPVVLCIDRAGLVGADGPTHHGLNDIAYLRTIPGMNLMAPRDGAELRAMLRLALQLEQPAAIRYPRERIPDEDGPQRSVELRLGRAETCREGADGVIIAYGALVHRAMEAAELLQQTDGLQVGVINARFVRPLDRDAICGAVASHGAVLVAEDARVAGGFGSAVLELLSEEGIPADNVRLAGVPMEFIQHAPRDDQLARCRLDGPGLADRMRRLVRQHAPA
jgi:1-deoxy-D-xylulose-5-phosphate synthase